MSGGTFRSGFGARRHPLLGYVRAHTGVDWSAPRGTPIMAAGDGEVVYADWKSGYGNYIEIRHTNGYETAYAHQTGFAKGIRKGARVRQGQVIGYVGSTGLSTGPHLHYEVHVNGNPVDPMRIRLPRGRTLEGDMLASFKSDRERIDTLLGGGSAPRLASAAAEAGG
ncbi:M23 family metallopeptidase [Scytonema tolypothrichoides VB-61278]|nr:M23 family metallopeptidase [Scytonema tolypothrichoides VB-61278]